MGVGSRDEDMVPRERGSLGTGRRALLLPRGRHVLWLTTQRAVQSGWRARLNLYSFQSAVESHYSARVTVNNAPPNVYAGADTATDEGHFFTQLGSFADPGADIWTASVDYGDGTGVQPLTCDEKNKTFELNHAYADDGIYTVTVRNRDDDMATDQRFPAALKTELWGAPARRGDQERSG